MKDSNVRESPISCDTLLITDSEFGVKQRVSKLLLECSMRQLHNDLIDSPEYKGITRSPLPQKYGYLPLPSYWGNFYGNFAHFYYPKLPKFLLKVLP